MKNIIIILDSLGIGADLHAADYGDQNANTLLNIKNAVSHMKLPNLLSLGLSNIKGLESLSDGIQIPTPVLPGSFARLMARSKGKDTTTGHWEIAGLITKTPFPTYPNGFPDSIVTEFEKKTGRKVIGNYPASGTEIIKNLGEHHMQSGNIILYTSADSVFQIAAHEEIVPLPQLYEYCKVARKILQPPHGVARVIARPFIGEIGNFVRTANRHDYSLPPPNLTMLDYIAKNDQSVIGIGKIYDIFVGSGITASIPTKNNMDGVDKLIKAMREPFDGLIFINLVDFDSLYGHRNDPDGYADALMHFDARLPEILDALGESDILYITADHGCDPTTESTDHTREYVPLLVYGKGLRSGVDLGTRKGFGHIAATVLDSLGVDGDVEGESFLSELTNPS